MAFTTTPPTRWDDLLEHPSMPLATLQGMTAAELQNLRMYLVDLNEAALTAQDKAVDGKTLVDFLGNSNFKGYYTTLPDPSDYQVGNTAWLYNQTPVANNGLVVLTEPIPGLLVWVAEDAEANIASGATAAPGSFVPQSGWSAASNALTDKSFDANNTDFQEVCDVLASVVKSLLDGGYFTP